MNRSVHQLNEVSLRMCLSGDQVSAIERLREALQCLCLQQQRQQSASRNCVSSEFSHSYNRRLCSLPSTNTFLGVLEGVEMGPPLSLKESLEETIYQTEQRTFYNKAFVIKTDVMMATKERLLLLDWNYQLLNIAVIAYNQGLLFHQLMNEGEDTKRQARACYEKAYAALRQNGALFRAQIWLVVSIVTNLLDVSLQTGCSVLDFHQQRARLLRLVSGSTSGLWIPYHDLCFFRILILCQTPSLLAPAA